MSRPEPQLHTQDPKCNPETGNRSVGPFRHGVLVHKGRKDADLSTDCECDVSDGAEAPMGNTKS